MSKNNNKLAKLKKLSRYLVRVLRHAPEELNLNPDATGRVLISDLLQQLQKKHKET